MQELMESLAAPAISDFLLMPTLLQYIATKGQYSGAW